MSSSECAVRIDNISYQVSSGSESLTILQNISADLPVGKTLSISGASGSGKTSLLSIMAGLALPSSGRVQWGDLTISDYDEDARAKLRAGRVGFIFQNFELLDNFTALDNVMLPLELLGEQDPEQRAVNALETVGLAKRLHHLPKQLSGGEQQRVAIARAFAINPSLLFADEPTGNLDMGTGSMVADLLFDLHHQQGTSLVIVTHDQSLVKRCEFQWVLSNGGIE